jgi:YesN/AraC family two-component response regulator
LAGNTGSSAGPKIDANLVYGLARIEQIKRSREHKVPRVDPELPARILIVDDYLGARIALRELLEWHSLHVCGDAKDGKEAIEKVIELKPDIVVLDIDMPRMNGVKAAKEIRLISPTTKIVFLTIHDTPSVMDRLWANGFVLKSAAGTELIPTLNRLAGDLPDGSRKSCCAATD